MFFIDVALLVGSVLLLIGIASSKISARLGVPVLVLFLVVGMLAGEEGIGRIHFDDYGVAYAVGTAALALILFDGGLGTSLESIRAVWKPSIALATLGVVVTAAVTGFAASLILKLSWLEGMLIGSIVGSTDASAVFAVLRSGGVTLPKKLASTLEIESASNDPMAIFMTIGCIQVLTGEMTLGVELLGMLVMQSVIGVTAGLVVGFVAVAVTNRIHLDATGLYPVLITAFGLLSYGLAVATGGSGFLAIFLAGIVIGNCRLSYQRSIRLFHDATAWLAQIAMFVVLGMLSTPSELIEAAPEGLLIAVVLMFVARPIAVALLVPWFRFDPREMTLLSWVGLKGAVPITLAIFPLIYSVPNAELIFNTVFFTVLLSSLVQGWSLAPVAKWLGLRLPTEPAPPVSLEISSLQHIDGSVLDFAVHPESRAAGHLVKDLALPAGAVISLIAREKKVIPPHGGTRIEAGDHVLVVATDEVAPLVNQVFAERSELPLDLPSLAAFPLRPTATIGELEDTYGVTTELPRHLTLVEAIRSRAGAKRLLQGETVPIGPIALQAMQVAPSGDIEQVGMIVLPSDPPEPPRATPESPPPTELPPDEVDAAPHGPAEEPPLEA